MTDCLWLADRMAEVALGRGEWTRTEREHLANCPSCRRGWELVRLTQSLGHAQLTRFESAEAGRTLLQRLEQSRKQRRGRRLVGLAGLGLAASLAALLWSHPADPAPTTSASVATELAIPLPELDGLEPVELDSVLSSIDEPLAADSVVDSPELGGFDSEELETVLDIWEG